MNVGKLIRIRGANVIGIVVKVDPDDQGLENPRYCVRGTNGRKYCLRLNSQYVEVI